MCFRDYLKLHNGATVLPRDSIQLLVFLLGLHKRIPFICKLSSNFVAEWVRKILLLKDDPRVNFECFDPDSRLFQYNIHCQRVRQFVEAECSAPQVPINDQK